MADRFPLILNTNNNQIQEIASGDNLDLTGTGINNAGIITAGNVTIGAATTDLIVTGDARVTGILTIGTSSLKLDGPNNLVNVGTALTLGHTQGLQFHTQNLHSAGFEVNQVNASGIITATGADINGDIDVDGHTNLDNVSVAGVTTFASNVNLGDNDKIILGDSDDLQIYHQSSNNQNYIDAIANGITNVRADILVLARLNSDKFAKFTAGGSSELYFSGNKRFETTSAGITVHGNGTVTGNLSVGGVLTYEDVTNVDSVGLVTARAGVFIPDNQTLKIGNTSASPDLTIEHVSSGNYNRIISTGYLQHRATSHFFNDQASNFNFIRLENKRVDLRYNGSAKLTTETSGVNITGICTATTFSGSGASLTNVDADTVDGIQGSNIFTLAGTQTVTGTKTFDCSGYDYNFDYDTSRTLIRIQRSGTEKLKLSTSSNEIYVEMANSGTLRFETSLVPRANNTYDLGSTSLRWANAYVNDLQLSNESKKDTGGNDVDGTWGDWTLQEGENDIFMINNRTGKKYSITMKEV